MSSCGGSMMKSTPTPFAYLVDRDAQRWADRERLAAHEKQALRDEILAAFHPGERNEMTFHGHRYQLTIRRAAGLMEIDVHQLPVQAQT